MERERKIKRTKEREKARGDSSSPVSPGFFPAFSLAFFFARAPLSERLEQASWASNRYSIGRIEASSLCRVVCFLKLGTLPHVFFLSLNRCINGSLPANR